MIYINGDSFTAGAGVREESGPESTWPYLLSKKMNLPIKEESRSGCSNYRIFRYALQEILSNHTLTHVVIMWTSYERQEFSIQGKNETFLPSSAIKTGQIYLKKIYEVAFKYAYDEIYLYQNWLRQIIAINELCKARHIKFISINYGGIDGSIQEPIDLDWWDNQYDSFLKRMPNFVDDNKCKQKFNQTKILHDALPPMYFLKPDKSWLINTGWAKNHPTKIGHEHICEYAHKLLTNE